MSWLKDRAEHRAALKKARAIGAGWHERNKVLPPSDTPVVFFVIPLISKARATNWDRIVANLQLTLSSLRGQTDPGWRAIVCSQDRPEGIVFDDRVEFLPFETADLVSEDTRTKFDNHAKRGKMARAIAATFHGDGYMFPLDADDILHPDYVAHVRQDNNGRGYVIQSGYMWDVQSGDLAPMRPSRWGGLHAFDRECGSCVAHRIDFRENDACLELVLKKGRHKWSRSISAEHGFPLDTIPFPAALYAVNHGENMREIRGKLGPKMQYITRHRLPRDEAARIRASFGLPD